ncbi:DUF2857 domain-containing protein [Pseudomonas lopnurensis]|uniref:DUF2857 domain-containing protein n=1 Tax=Pseudomonas lopnurensis TaxID=1477517 RepID=UPI0028ACB7B1|nr:DUF2857 domain-containing protein [Pseudomonas lopnurensis]
MTDSSLNTAVLHQVMTHLRDGHFRRCLELGFKQDELVQLNQLSLSDISELTRMPVRFVEISINHDLLSKALGRLQEEGLRQQMIQRAIRLGASIEMLHSLFGITSEEVSARRRLMGINIKPGRPQMPDVDEMNHLWARWQKLIAETGAKLDRSDPTAALDAMMLLAEETGKPLSIVWKLIHEWEADVQKMLRRSTKGKPKARGKASSTSPSSSRLETAQ